MFISSPRPIPTPTEHFTGKSGQEMDLAPVIAMNPDSLDPLEYATEMGKSQILKQNISEAISCRKLKFDGVMFWKFSFFFVYKIL